MSYLCTILIIGLAVFAAITMSSMVASFMANRLKTHYGRVMCALGLMISFSSFTYLMEVLAADYESKLIWNYLQYLTNSFISPLWLTGVLLYTDRLRKHRALKIAAIFLIPFLSFVFRYTNDWHHLYFKSLELTELNGLLLLERIPGPWMVVQGLTAGLLVIVTLVELLRYFKLSGELYSGKTLMIFIGAFICIFGLSIGMLRFTPININTVICIPLEVLMVTFAILRDDFLDVKNHARDIAFDSSDIGLITLNAKYKIIDYNLTAVNILGRSGIGLEPVSVDRLLPGKEPLNAILKSSERSTWKTLECEGVKYYEFYTNRLMRRGEVHGYVKTLRDITDIQEEADSLRHQASVDELSGLYNRREFMRLAQCVLSESGGSPCSLIMFDIDFFKRINDSRGHLTGDYVISCIGEVTLKHFGQTDICGRIGGEEFAVLLRADKEAAFIKAEELRLAFETCEMMADNEPLRATISLGIAQAQEGHKITDLINMADKALYVSKNKGRNRSTVYMENP